MLDLESKNTLAGLNNDPNDSVRVKAKAVLRFKYRIDERWALKGPPITGPEWESALTPIAYHRDGLEQRRWLTSSIPATLLLDYLVWLWIPMWRHLHKMNFTKELRAGWGQNWNYIMGKIKELIRQVKKHVKRKPPSNILTAKIETRDLGLSHVVWEGRSRIQIQESISS